MTQGDIVRRSGFEEEVEGALGGLGQAEFTYLSAGSLPDFQRGYRWKISGEESWNDSENVAWRQILCKKKKPSCRTCTTATRSLFTYRPTTIITISHATLPAFVISDSQQEVFIFLTPIKTSCSKTSSSFPRITIFQPTLGFVPACLHQRKSQK